MDFVAVAAVKSDDARIADGKLLTVHKGMHRAVERVVAQNLGAPNGGFVIFKNAEAFFEGEEKLRWIFVVHFPAKPEKRLHPHGENEVEQRVWSLIAQKKSVAFVRRGTDGFRVNGVDFLAEEIMRHNGWHSFLLFRARRLRDAAFGCHERLIFAMI
ncbi:MAG: hypothetical protein ACLT98_10810 [Eggerthellaceae bacterium]